MKEKIAEAQEAALSLIAAAATLDDLRETEPALFGKKAALGQMRRELGGLEPDDRRQMGQALNAARDEVQAELNDKRSGLEKVARRVQLEAERLDLTEATSSSEWGHQHLISQTMERLEDVFVGMGFQVAEGPEAEDDWNNFGSLNFPDDHPARAMQDTLYVDLNEAESTLLRTHTSPVQVRTMKKQKPPIYIIAPGRVYRRDTADATHFPVFHQIEGLVIDRGISMADLAGILDEFTRAYFGRDIKSRLRPSFFPFTEPSAEYDITDPNQRTGWLELGGCGMVHPNVLMNCGIDPEEWTGFAFGFGIDRLAMMRHEVDDLREMFTNDLRFLRQF